MGSWGNKDTKAANTGTIAIAGAVVTGTGTLFDAEVSVGDWLKVPFNGDAGVVASVGSNTALVLDRSMTTVAANTFTLSEKPNFIRIDTKGADANSVFGVDVTEIGVTQGAGHTGWVKRIVGTGGRAGRIQYEVLVAGGIVGDADDDAQFSATGMASQMLDFALNTAVPGGIPDDVLTVVRNTPGFPLNVDGGTVTTTLVNKLMRSTAGLCIWESRTNRAPDSINFTAFTVRGLPLDNDRDQLDPAGTMTASTLSVGATMVLDIFQTIVGQPTATDYAFSFFIKRATTTGLLRVQRTSMTFGELGQWDIDMALLPDAWVRLTALHPAVTEIEAWKTSTTGVAGIHFFTVDAVTRTFDIWGVQLDQGLTVSPHRQTNGGGAVREKDDISQPVSQMGFGPNEGTVVIELVTPDEADGLRVLWSMNDGTTSNRLILFRESNLTYSLLHEVADVELRHKPTGISQLTGHKIAVGWKAGKINLSVDGTSVQTFDTVDGLDFIPQATFDLGQTAGGALQLNSTVKALTSYPDYSSDAALQARST